jgi:nucleotide-binding universal stress UspA family protein
LDRGCNRFILVGIDGSELSFKALRWAVANANETKDNVWAVHIKKKGVSNEEIKILGSKCTSIAQDLGMYIKRVAFRAVELPENGDWSVADVLIYLANHVANAKGILVVGAAGKAGEETRPKNAPSGQPPMGSMAKKCVELCKMPVFIVKSTESPITQEGVKRGQRPSRNNTQGGLTHMVTIDNNVNLSRIAFDTAVKCLRPGKDKLVIFHIDTTYSGGDYEALESVKAVYKEECEKLNASYNLPSDSPKASELVVVTKDKKLSIKDHIIKYADEQMVDSIFMGSAEMSKMTKDARLGSVVKAISQESTAHVTIVKWFNNAY